MHRLLGAPEIAPFVQRLGSASVKTAIDAVLQDARARLATDPKAAPLETLVAHIAARLAREDDEGLVSVINGTGVLLHTNLGRAPLAPAALEAMAALGAGYSNLEFDLASGARGSRYARVTALLCAATGAQDALVVNNCAGAVLLILDTFASGRDVIVSRGELVEIGGGFRLPEVLARSGATLVEVGTTNKTSVRDFERGLTPNTALLLRTHASNYRIEGFTASVAASDLVQLGRRVSIPTVEDLGSGALVDLARFGLPHERTVTEAVTDGIGLVTFSGDKLLGGPQAGIIVGKTSAVARLRGNALLRALRVDKSTLAALAATLRLYLEPGGLQKIPLYGMLGMSVTDLRRRAERIAAQTSSSDIDVTPLPLQGYVGGGCLPNATVASYGIAVRTARDAAARCRTLTPRSSACGRPRPRRGRLHRLACGCAGRTTTPPSASAVAALAGA